MLKNISPKVTTDIVNTLDPLFLIFLAADKISSSSS